ncbi:hypothetical protein Zmor_001412 [Zophobas morio]|uniref:Uncharacterized protein n=1 Tax=Zophobas morio TaxID=2755281 RepID=A0AA38J1P3_9CUCU|nr:hypothetical protein Zmor_001412 [Zophobas morio]
MAARQTCAKCRTVFGRAQFRPATEGKLQIRAEGELRSIDREVVFIKTADHCGIISVLWRNHHAYYRNGVLNEDGDGVYSVEASKNEYLVKCSVVIDEESLKTLYGELWPDLTTLVAFLSENRRGGLKLVKTLLKI